jgi:CRISPR/Cas system-associated exonuclease Cas4 (RecB family)
MKIRCPTGVHHDIEDARTCPNCIEFMTKPVLHSLLNRNSKEKKEHERPRFGVGTLTSNCLRQAYYKMTEEEILDLDKLWVFSRGHALHEFVTQTLAPKTEKEIFVTKKFNNFDIIGFIDAMYNNVIYEFKTTTNIPDTPQSHHTLQVQGYYSLLDENLQKEIENIKIVYMNLSKVKAYEVQQRDITAFMESRAAFLVQSLKMKTPPRREITWLCKYCEFHDTCFNRDKIFN